jgi:hypothetical protein
MAARTIRKMAQDLPGCRRSISNPHKSVLGHCTVGSQDQGNRSACHIPDTRLRVDLLPALRAAGQTMCPTCAAAGSWPRRSHLPRLGRYPGCMTVRELLVSLQQLPKDAELLALEPGCEVYCEREVDEVEWQGGRVYLHLGVRRDD